MAKKRPEIKGLDNPLTPTGKQASKPASKPKRTASFYFEPDMVTRLDVARGRLLQLTGAAPGELSKSAIVETALRLALDDLDAYEERAALVALLTPDR